MAATTVSCRASLTNGVSFGKIYTVTSTDATNQAIIFNFNVNYDLVAQFQVVDSSNVFVSLADAVITYPAKGQVEIANGASTFALTNGYKISLIVQRKGA